MKAALLKVAGRGPEGPGEIMIEEVPVPEISDDEALMEVKYCGICGTDLASYLGSFYEPGTYMGHEYSGVLVKVGKNVKGFKVGDRVVGECLYACGDCYGCRHGRGPALCDEVWVRTTGDTPGLEHAGAFANFMRIPDPKHILHILPGELSFEEGALVEPLAACIHAVRISDFRVGDSTMVVGTGPIGLMVISVLRYAGAGLIIATEVNERRCAMAKKMGADYVFNPRKEPNLKEKVRELTKGLGVDVAFNCSRSREALQSIWGHVGAGHPFERGFLRDGGQIMAVAYIPEEVEFLPVTFVIREYELKGTDAWYADEFPISIELLRKHIFPYKELITRKIKLSNIVKEGFEVLTSPDHKEIKILVEPDE